MNSSRFVPGLTLAFACLLAACGRNEVQVYRVSKETPAAEPSTSGSAAMPPGHPETAAAEPKLDWTVPSGWETVPPGEMRLASFRVNGSAGKTADVSIVPLAGGGGSDLANLNRWRGQVGLGEVTEAEIPKLAQPVEIAGKTGQIFDLAGENAGSGEKVRILVATLRLNDVAWFFKMTGDSDLVTQQKPAFVEFLKTMKFIAPTEQAMPASHPAIAGGAMPMGATGAAGGSEGKPTWQTPAGWQEVPGGQFLVAKFQLTGPGNTQAAVNVSSSPGEGGGLAMNVNRWRRQLGLAELSEEDVNKSVISMSVDGGKAKQVELSGFDPRTNSKASLVGILVPHDGQTWFFKLMGPETLVAKEKPAFLEFLQTIKAP